MCLASARELLARAADFVEVECPACGSTGREPAFEKYGYRYWSCANCASIYVSPRPTAPQLDQYLLESQAARYRDSAAYRQAMAQRAQDLGCYRADWISELGERIRAGRQRPVVDVETRTPDYLIALSKRQDSPLITVKPLGSWFNTLNLPNPLSRVNDLAKIAGLKAKLVTAFDVLEHQAQLFDWMSAVHATLDPGGLLVLTTRSGSGFDIQVLWQDATIFPVEHINLVSVEGIQALLTRTGFELVEVSTPGQLDIQMIERIWREQPELDLPRFLRYFLAQRDRQAKSRLQQFLQANLLSSHLRVVAKRAA
jgi:hypothetical protein